jgi:hemolysin activation/secretion protein
VYAETWSNYTALNMDNRGSAAVGPLQSYFASNFNSSFVGGDTLGVNLSTIPDNPRELGFGRLLYNAPVGIDGARIAAIASYSEVRPGDDRKDVDTRDRAGTFELRGSIVPIRTRESSLWLSAAASVGEFDENDLFGTNYRDHLRTVSLTADYQLHDTLDGWNYWTTTVRQGLDILGASQKGDPLLSRSDGSGTFSKLEAFYTRYQKLTDVWSLKMSFAGQLVSTPVLASEEFYLGSPFGRGYYAAEISGDNGIGGSLELRFDQTLKHDFFKGYQLYGYVDRTVAWNFHSDGDVLALSLVGAGARLYLANDLQVGVEAAVPLEYRTPFEQARNPRAFFYVSKVFKLCPGSTQMRCS